MDRSQIKDWHIRDSKEYEYTLLAEELAKQIEPKANHYDQTGEFPHESFDVLRKAGFFKLSVPKCYGGEEASLYEILLILERLAKGDGSVALAAGWHLCMFLNLRDSRKWKEEVFEKVCKDTVENGHVLNMFATERSTGNIFRGAKLATVAKKTAKGFILSGRKAFATLAPIVNQFSVIAWIEDEAVAGEFLVQMNDKVKIVETWNTIGMRATGSHDIILSDVFVPEDALLTRMEQKKVEKNRPTLLVIPAVFLGVAHEARDFIIEYTSSRYSHSLDGTLSNAPHVQQKIGEIEALLKSSRTILFTLAAKWDQSPEERELLFDDFHAAKYTICNNAIRIVELAMRIAGGHSLSKDYKLERLFRDVQCGLPMHPADDMIINQLAKGAFSIA
ncbi:acyl-CoA dehydrogenase family protein [Bacillus norwichensis]|uniref:Acyl-CoA/acyl-ACP dehydrogenase n=1 Tax=Bacillus norwichensis TaxID=2762217 RepID=A0ABR8VR76_9BACI|nr:acyl-CoA dehydrogenase family protein [Bacillus norwichensis]MBD8007274.1 acyl-CoA/acyl-ACP dehydrogenase [Bacillus norwichensis]